MSDKRTNPLVAIWHLLRSLGKRGDVKQEIDDELRFHIEQRAAENIAGGMSAEKAAREARKRFGNLQSVREECREINSTNVGETTLRDLRFGLRMLGSNPGFTTIAILSLAIGMGVNIMLFSLFNAIFLRPVPCVNAPRQIVTLKRIDKNGAQMRFSYPDYEEYRDKNSVFSGMYAWLDLDVAAGMGADSITLGNRTEEQNPAAGESNLEEVPVLMVSDNYFSTLGVQAALGRTFLPEKTKTPGSRPVVVLSHRLWERRFGSDRGILGRTLMLNGVAFTVVGIAPADFIGTGDMRAIDAWVPLMMMAELTHQKNWEDLRARSYFQMAGRLKSGVNLKEAWASLKVLHAQVAPREMALADRSSLSLKAAGTLAPLSESIGLVVPAMLAVSLVLVIACANVGSLLLARAIARRKEMAVRIAVGANRLRIIRQLLTESALIALSGGALGLLMGFWFCRAGWAFLQGSIPELQSYLVALNLSPDPRTMAYAFLLSLVTALVFGLAPAFASSRINPNAILKDEGAFFGLPISRSRLRNLFVIVQMAACLTLLIGVVQLLTAERKASVAKLGFEANDVILARFDLFRHAYPKSRVVAFQNQLSERLKTLPGVTHVSLAKNTFVLSRHVDWVSPGYFETMGVPMLRGRDFTRGDLQNGAAVAIISQATAERLWPGKDPIGQHLTNAPFPEIIGVVGNVRNMREILFSQSCYTPALPGAGHQDYLYLPASGTNFDPSHISVLVKTVEMKSIMAAIQNEVRSLDPDVLVSCGALTQDMQDSLSFFRFLEAIANLIGVVALLMSAMGIYGVVAFAASQRTREIGIRIALGARRGDVLRLTMRRGVCLVAGGLILGIPSAFALSTVLSSALIDLHSLDPLTFLLAALCLGIVMMLACYLPARRAAKTDPMTALRYE